MKNVLKRAVKKEDGMLIVEATYVFPIMVIVIFLMIYAGNAYLQKCRVEAIVTREIINGAAYCGDPVTMQIEDNGGAVPDDLEVYPYRFLAGDVDGFSDLIHSRIHDEISSMDGGLFKSMTPESITIDGPVFNNAFIYATVSADVEYKITLPIRILFEEEPIIMDFTVRVDVPVSDSVELIRNIDMVEDYLYQSENATKGIEKIQDMIGNVKGKFGLGE